MYVFNFLNSILISNHEGLYVFNHSLGCMYIEKFIGKTRKFVPLTTAGR